MVQTLVRSEDFLVIDKVVVTGEDPCVLSEAVWAVPCEFLMASVYSFSPQCNVKFEFDFQLSIPVHLLYNKSVSFCPNYINYKITLIQEIFKVIFCNHEISFILSMLEKKQNVYFTFFLFRMHCHFIYLFHILRKEKLLDPPREALTALTWIVEPMSGVTPHVKGWRTPLNRLNNFLLPKIQDMHKITPHVRGWKTPLNRPNNFLLPKIQDMHKKPMEVCSHTQLTETRQSTYDKSWLLQNYSYGSIIDTPFIKRQSLCVT